jgi:hypothetical protein
MFQGKSSWTRLTGWSAILATPLPVTLQLARRVLNDEQANLIAQVSGGMQLAGDDVTYPTFQTTILAGEIAADRITAFLD